MNDRVGRCHDCTAPQTEVNMLSRHILELQKDKGDLTDRVRELEESNREWQRTCEAKSDTNSQLTEQLADKVEKIAELEKKNAELETEIETKDILIKELQEQKLYWKDSSFDWRRKFFKLDKIKRLVKKDKQLTKAKELLQRFVKWATTETCKCEKFDSILEDTKQFLKECK